MRVEEASTLMNKDDLPEILTAQHIATYLGISRRRVYELFQTFSSAGGIPNFDIGASKRVEKKDFFAWIDARKQEKTLSNSG
ncbi:DNA-binding protein [Desulfosporosinus fructosivorans]|uniref:DNA-binding protein n=2 Tax=Desulfosporosinus fructosivorans TaxID=2018669 RepID=A0A4Z0R4I7_9FIRM|nr:DNA-binding protein [Desulfosporosinus fructosivorans]